MTNNRKPIKSYRLDAETHRQIDELAKRWNTSQSNALARCVERVYQQDTVLHEPEE